MASIANGTSRCGFLYSPAAAGVFSKPAYANSSSSAVSPSTPGRGASSAVTTDQSTKRSPTRTRSEEHTSELQSRENLVCRLLLEKKKYTKYNSHLPSIVSKKPN